MITANISLRGNDIHINDFITVPVDIRSLFMNDNLSLPYI